MNIRSAQCLVVMRKPVYNIRTPKDADQPAHPHSLAQSDQSMVFTALDSTTPSIVAVTILSSILLASASLSLTWS